MASMTVKAINGQLVALTDPAKIQEYINAYEQAIRALIPELESADATRCKAALDRYALLCFTLDQIAEQLPAYNAQLVEEGIIGQARDLAQKLQNPDAQ
jgi:hypothetical protein